LKAAETSILVREREDGAFFATFFSGLDRCFGSMRRSFLKELCAGSEGRARTESRDAVSRRSGASPVMRRNAAFGFLNVGCSRTIDRPEFSRSNSRSARELPDGVVKNVDVI